MKAPTLLSVTNRLEVTMPQIRSKITRAIRIMTIIQFIPPLNYQAGI